LRALIWFFSWLTALLSHKVIVVSDYDLRVARRMPFVGHKTIRIYNGIDLHMQFGLGERIRNAFPPGVHITGTVGELTKNKNQKVLIGRAKKDPTMYAAIVGEGEEHTALESEIKKHGLEDRIKLFGFMPATDVLRGFDTFVLPSRKEGLPYVLLEAKCAGLPIEADRTVGGIGEVLDKPISDFSLKQMLQKTTELYLPTGQAGHTRR
jgi:glycosyltransferase involved in cell wall biosynthesis